jgi:hypothetical protein
MSLPYDAKDFETVIPPDEPSASKPFQLPDKIKKGDRRATLRRMFRSQQARHIPFKAAVAACDIVNRDHCDPPLEAKELEYQRWWNERDQPGFGTHAKAEGPTRLDPAVLCDATVVAAEGRALAEQGVQYLVDGIVPAYGMLGMLVAFAKVGKTTLGQALGAAVANGHPFIGRATMQARVLVIAAEDPPEYTAYVARNLVTPPGAMTFYRASVILNDNGLAGITAEIHEGKYGLVLISSWQSVIRGLVRDENDNAGAVLVVEDVKAAARTGGVPWLIDAHSGKGEDQADDADPSRAMRGASAAAGAADYALWLRYADGAFGNLRRLSGKGRFVSLEPQTIAYDKDTGEFRSLGATKTATQETTWELIRKTGALTAEPKTVDAIARAVGFTGASGKVTGSGRRKVQEALRGREGVVTTVETRNGQKTTLYYRSGSFVQMDLGAGA